MIDWDFSRLEDLIQDRGDTMVAETGVLCPACQNNDPYASRIDHNGRPAVIRSLACSTCQGNGFMYRNARCIKGLLTSINPTNKDLLDAGYSMPGDAILSPSLQAGFLGDFDRVTFSSITVSVDSQVIVRGAATLHDNAALDTDLTPEQDRLWYIPACILWCEDSNGVIYTQGQDYSLVDKKIIWTNGPLPGTVYSVKYRAYMEWVVYNAPLERFDRGRSLAQRVMLRKKHVHFMTGSHAETPITRGIEQTTLNKVAKL